VAFFHGPTSDFHWQRIHYGNADGRTEKVDHHRCDSLHTPGAMDAVLELASSFQSSEKSETRVMGHSIVNTFQLNGITLLRILSRQIGGELAFPTLPNHFIVLFQQCVTYYMDWPRRTPKLRPRISNASSLPLNLKTWKNPGLLDRLARALIDFTRRVLFLNPEAR
jgi:hypothetical protein